MYHEIVKVISGTALINAESYQREYVTRSQRALQPGFYIVLWPGRNGEAWFGGTQYDGNAQYVGPFSTQLDAKLAYQRNHWVAPQPQTEM